MAVDVVYGIPVDNFFPYQTIVINRSDIIGRGSYGYVCRAKCDRLPCAAKTIHQILFQCGDSEGLAKVVSNFVHECNLLRTLSHPNVVQFIGVCTIQGEDSSHVLLTELMDESLWNYISARRKTKLPVLREISIMNDVSLALSYLHNKNIIHRDLSSNNILLKDNTAKVTDFGMAKFKDASRKYLTQCPGTAIFMAPEALNDEPTCKYSDKLDIFSWGVVCVHLLSRCDPDPAPGLKSKVDSAGQEVFVRVPEIERRSKEISQIDSSHPLLSLTLCTLGVAENRPTANQLCDKIETIKCELGKKRKAEENYKLLTKQNEKESRGLKDSGRETKETCLKKENGKREEKEREEKEREETERGEKERQGKEKVVESLNEDIKISPILPSLSLSGNNPFKWRSIISEAPCVFPAGSSITTLAGRVFLSRPHSSIVHIYDPTSYKWSTLHAPCPVENFTIVAHIGKILAVGGINPETRKGSKCVYSYDVLHSTRTTQWNCDLIQGISYERVFPAVASSKTILLVAGGSDPKSGSPLYSVEIHNGSQWYSTYNLPVPLSLGNALISDNGTVFVIGGSRDKGTFILSYSLDTLINWSSNWIPLFAVRETWKTTPSPVSSPGAVLVAKQLVLVGGIIEQDGRSFSCDGYTDNIYMRPLCEDGKFNISIMPRARGCCLATVLPGNADLVMVVGGCGSKVIDIGKLDN